MYRAGYLKRFFFLGFILVVSPKEAWPFDGACNDAIIALLQPSQAPFIRRVQADSDSWLNSLALNLSYRPLKDLRAYAERVTELKLDFFKDWDPH